MKGGEQTCSVLYCNVLEGIMFYEDLARNLRNTAEEYDGGVVFLLLNCPQLGWH